MVSGERFVITYSIFGTQQEAFSKARDICFEQTVEFPADLLPASVIQDNVLGSIESFEPCGGHYTFSW